MTTPSWVCDRCGTGWNVDTGVLTRHLETQACTFCDEKLVDTFCSLGESRGVVVGDELLGVLGAEADQLRRLEIIRERFEAIAESCDGETLVACEQVAAAMSSTVRRRLRVQYQLDQQKYPLDAEDYD